MEFSQFYFGSLLSNSNTFLLAWPQVHFEATFGLPMTPRRTVTEAVGSEKLVDGPAFTVDFMAGPSGSAVAPARPGRHTYLAFPNLVTRHGPVQDAAAFFSSPLKGILTP